MVKKVGEFLNTELMKKTFHCFRLIDMESRKMISEELGELSASFVEEFDFEDCQNQYEQCLLQKCVTYQMRQFSHNLLLYALHPVWHGDKRYVIECIANISESVEIQEASKMFESVYQLSVTDELTGVYNRRYINNRLPIAITHCKKRKVPLSVIFTDLDFFKDINDLYGHATGDYLLSQFALDLQCNIRQGIDWVARYGGDEFLLCLQGADEEKTRMVAERIRQSIEKKILTYRGNSFQTTCSLGIYTLDCDAVEESNYEFILKEVDKHLYMAKSQGRNLVK